MYFVASYYNGVSQCAVQMLINVSVELATCHHFGG